MHRRKYCIQACGLIRTAQAKTCRSPESALAMRSFVFILYPVMSFEPKGTGLRDKQWEVEGCELFLGPSDLYSSYKYWYAEIEIFGRKSCCWSSDFVQLVFSWTWESLEMEKLQVYILYLILGSRHPQVWMWPHQTRMFLTASIILVRGRSHDLRLNKL